MRRRSRSGACRCCPGTASRPGCTACAWWASTWSWARPWRYVRARGRRGSGAGRLASPPTPPRNARLCGAALRPAGIGHFLWGGVARLRGKRGRAREGTAVLRNPRGLTAPSRRALPLRSRWGWEINCRNGSVRRFHVPFIVCPCGNQLRRREKLPRCVPLWLGHRFSGGARWLA